MMESQRAIATAIRGCDSTPPCRVAGPALPLDAIGPVPRTFLVGCNGEHHDRLAHMYIIVYIQEMSKRYSIADARANLPSIVDEAESGQAIELTRRGKPVAVIVSLRELERLRGARPQFSDAYRKFLESHTPRDVGIDADFFRSMRDREPGRKVSL
jgi:prevent-host-death family protein